MADKTDKPESDRDAVRDLVEYERRLEQNADKTFGRNGGVACDTSRGPCNCGAWH